MIDHLAALEAEKSRLIRKANPAPKDMRLIFAYDAAIALMRGQSATGKLNGYMFREKAIEILMDSEIPMWMTNTPGIRVTVSAAPPAAKQERDDA